MQEIQTACATLARHQDSSVSHLALRIAEFDLIRDLNHDNQCVEKDALISARSAEIKVLKADSRLLRAQVNKLADMNFGPSSEKTDSQPKKDKSVPEDPQNAPPSSASQNSEDTEKKKIKPRGMRGRQAVEIPDNLPRDLRVIEPENGSICACGCGMRLMGEQVIERLSYKPAEIRVIEEHYLKYVCRTCERFVQAPVPKRAFDYTRFDDSLIAGLAVSKFADFLPNYRQEQIFKRSDIRLHRSSMSRMMDEAVDALLPLHAALEADLKASSKLFMDETVLAQLQPGSGRTKTCYIWALCRDDRRWKGNAPPAVVFHFKQSRKGAHALEILNGFQGILQVVWV